jgi:GNAT superfamily N-acetyltransferase
MPLTVGPAPAQFSDWKGLLALLHAAFAYQEPRIDPPSSLHRLSEHGIAQKAQDERLFLAFDGDELVGCAFAKAQPQSLYIGKMAVRPGRQGQGIGRLLLASIEQFARQAGHAVIELETRVELTENHQTFGAWGFVKTAEHAHAGYTRPTSITMQKALVARAANESASQ